MKSRMKISLTPQGEKTIRLVDSWPERSRRFFHQIAFQLTEAFRHRLLEHIPASPDYASYRNALETVSLGAAVPAFAVRVNARKKGIRQVDAAANILYVRSSRRLKKTSPAIAVLEKYSPWTANTLPFSPRKSEADVVVRRVTKNEVLRIERSRRRDKRLWRSELARVGVDSPRASEQGAIKSAIPDVAFEGYRLEFGAKGQRPKQHWRPALRALVGGNTIKTLLRNRKEITRAFMDLSFRAWSSWPRPKAHRQIKAADARKFLPFARKLGKFGNSK